MASGIVLLRITVTAASPPGEVGAGGDAAGMAAAGKTRNKFGLTLGNVSVGTEAVAPAAAASGGGGDGGTTNNGVLGAALVSEAAAASGAGGQLSGLEAQLDAMGLTEQERRTMESWLLQKAAVIGGELREEDFEKIGELGYGNGGVVMKVRHKPTGIIMARKVPPSSSPPSLPSP